MKKEIIYQLQTPYRSDMKISGFRFGKGEKTACIVGALRGNEIQQLYICSQIIKTLKILEERGDIVSNNEILVIPSVNHFSMNIGKRFWQPEDSDINRMFPGDIEGETAMRIAGGLFEKIKDYNYGIQFASFYMPGDFVPHVRMMETKYHSTSLANLFGLPYVVVRKPKPFDKMTLNYNWQEFRTNAFSVYTNKTEEIDETSANQAVSAVIRFLTRMGIIHYNNHGGFIASIIAEEDLYNVKSNGAGIYRRKALPGQEIKRGDMLAVILDPYEGTVIHEIQAPTDGIVFFAHRNPLVNEGDSIYKIIRRLHK